MKKLVLFFISILFCCSNLYSQIVINEIMYAPSDPNNEWFELYNTGNTPVNLSNWKWKDATATVRTITTSNINIFPNNYIIICQDSVRLRSQFANLQGIIIQTAWSQLNNTGDNLILIDPSNNRIDSVAFQSSWGGSSGGFSLEKIDPSGPSNNASNWGTSIDPQMATPNRQNSITPKPFDIILRSFTITPLFPVAGETLQLNFVIKNIGLNPANNFLLNIYKDVNFDSIPQNNELINSQSYQTLSPADSLLYTFSIANIDTGLKQYIGKLNYPKDEDTLNNTIIRRINVAGQGGGGGIVINEIMYDPLTDQSEWVEFYNASGQTVNLKGWKYKETSTSITLFTTDVLMNPGDYLVLAHDSTLYTTFGYLRTPEPNQIIKFSSSISLSNSGESISLTDSLNNIIDAVTYDPDWHNTNLSDTKGISLERINPAFGSNDRDNWSSCANPRGGTPGLQNSIFTPNLPSNSTVSITPNPFSPDGDGFEDFALIKYKLNIPFGQMVVKVFDIKGRLVRTLSNNQVTGSEGTIIFNGVGDDNQKLRIGIYILLIEAIDDRGGTVDNIKTPMVIAAKL